jgi:plasmid stabilization system protein ParE
VATVVWLPEALEDVARLHDFLAEKNERAARTAAERIAYAARQLEKFPDIGQPMDDGVRRQVFIHFGAGSYVVRYRRDQQGNVVVVRVWHSRERREG